MENKLHFMSLWSINDDLDSSRLKTQLLEMRKCGLTGAIFHPRYYPGNPAYMSKEYLDIVSEVILYAKEIGMEFWIYDENGWPSGYADGQVLKKFPDSKCEWLEWTGQKVEIRSYNEFNTFFRDEMQFFIDYTYEGYRKGLLQEAWNYVTGFFSDEVGFLNGHGVSTNKGGIPWCEEVRERYKKLYHKDICEQWHLLFIDGEGYEQVRYRYWEILTDVLTESFYRSINDWCSTHGKKHTAHLKGEENLFFQTSYSGSCYWTLKEVSVPAIDALERYPGNHYYPRIVSSLAKQFYDGDCLCETLGGSGWGLKPEDVERYIDWLAESGVNYFAFHLWQYSKKSSSVRDWPPNIPNGMTWKSAASSLFEKMKRKWDGEIYHENKTLIVAPVRGVMAEFDPKSAMQINEHNGANTPDNKSGRISMRFEKLIEKCYAMGLEFDVTEERIIENYGQLEKGTLRIGKQNYEQIIFAEGCLWENEEFYQNLADTVETIDASAMIWHLIRNGINQIPLETLSCRIPWKCKNVTTAQVRLLDPVKSVKVMGIQLKKYQVDQWDYYEIPQDVLIDAKNKGYVEITIEPNQTGEQQPFAFLEGNFLVKSKKDYQEKDSRQLITDGDFYICDALHDVDCKDLITAGYPFCESFVQTRAILPVSENGKLELSSIMADCAFVEIDGDKYGYIWGSDWMLEGMTPGFHTVDVTLYPSTYNAYGPHHHMEGDRHVISPEQYAGKKNFADFEDAPDNTFIPQWHFVKFGIS